MADLGQAVQDFLSRKRLAVAGVSRDGNLPANLIFRKLRDAGYEVFPVNPSASEVEGVPCFRTWPPCRRASKGWWWLLPRVLSAP